MRNVLSKSEVAHYWANQRQQSGRVSSGNFYFEGRTIYSYGSHFPIASISEQDNHVVLFTTRGYSNTTTKHIAETLGAASHKKLIYCYDPKQATCGIHSGNIKEFEAQARTLSLKLPKSTKPEIWLSQIAEQKRLLVQYVDFFKIKPSVYKHLHYIHIVTKDEAIKATEQERKALLKAQKEREKQQAIYRAQLLVKETDNLKLWKGFKKPYTSKSTRLFFQVLENTFLRFNKAEEQIETSKGVEIPIKVAERFYKWINQKLKHGGCLNGECNQKILGYEVTHVDNLGIKIGCHDITWTEINTIAKKLKWQ